nr:hypothetical protein [Actinomycetota bacterium]
MSEAERLRRLGLWLALARLIAVFLAASQIAFTDSFPEGYHTWAWAVWAAFAAGSVAIALVTTRHFSVTARNRMAVAVLGFDLVAAFAFMVLFSFESGQPVWAVLYLPVIEGALRFRLLGGVATSVACLPLLATAEVFRADRFAPESLRLDVVAARGGFALLLGTVLGGVVSALVEQGKLSDQR